MDNMMCNLSPQTFIAILAGVSSGTTLAGVMLLKVMDKKLNGKDIKRVSCRIEEIRDCVKSSAGSSARMEKNVRSLSNTFIRHSTSEAGAFGRLEGKIDKLLD